MKEGPLTTIENILDDLVRNTSGIFSRTPLPIFVLPLKISNIVGDDIIHISEFVIAKVQGRMGFNKGHPEITREIFLTIPDTLSEPFKIHEDKRMVDRSK